jgi:Glutathione S-transferase, N-terminal domain/Sigma-70, region 4
MEPEPRIAGAWRRDTATRPVPRLYYMPRTRSSRVLWLLAELDAPCELVKLAPEQRTSAEHRARHPLGRVPALELDDGNGHVRVSEELIGMRRQGASLSQIARGFDISRERVRQILQRDGW